MTPFAWRSNGLHAATIAALSIAVASCAVAANDVQVDTMPMRQALDLTRSQAGADLARAQIHSYLAAPVPPDIAPAGLLTSPDVRFAYLYEWVDSDGNRHFGEWIAIPVGAAQWIMSDGTKSGIEPPAHPKEVLREQR